MVDLVDVDGTSSAIIEDEGDDDPVLFDEVVNLDILRKSTGN